MSLSTSITGEQGGLWSDLPLAFRARSGRARAKELGQGPSSPPPELSALVADPDGVLLLDVETTGLSRHYDAITLVGWQYRGSYHVHIAGDDPEALMRVTREATGLVTFNGKLFDVPFMRQEFAGLEIPQLHVDLRFASRRLGLVGGQKAIEGRLGAGVRDGINVDGAAAVILWHRYLRGEVGALRDLIAYNRADVLGMAFILDHLIDSWGLRRGLFDERRTFVSTFKGSVGAADDRSPLPSPTRLARRAPTYGELFGGHPCTAGTIVGVDLTGSEARPSGVASLNGATVTTTTLSSDDDIVAYVLAAAPVLVSVDSPLSLPWGRKSVFDDDPGRAEFGIMRRCERELKRRGINVYPCLLPSMQRLTARGMALADRIRMLGIPVIESYPGAAQDILGIPRKGAGPAWLTLGLASFGLEGDFAAGGVSHDELDAITSALVGTFFLAGRYEPLTGPQENALIVPLLEPPGRPLVVGISGRIAAGKTTAARVFEERGFSYTRFSEVVDDEIRAEGSVPERASRQEVGMRLHETRGQRWLCERVLQRVGEARLVVIDGMRWVEDATFFHERFGPNFVHLHLDAAAATRGARYRGDGAGRSFDDADGQPVEGQIDVLGSLAGTRLVNESDLDGFVSSISDLAERLLATSERQCRSQS